jgi:secreted trypsin-like serine protease
VEALIGENIRSAEEYEFPFIVAITKYYVEHGWESRYTCTGSLISTTDVLTSEHCLTAEELNRIHILIGSSFLDSATRYYPMWWITFDQWAAYNNHEIVHNSNDIAILKVIICF